MKLKKILILIIGVMIITTLGMNGKAYATTPVPTASSDLKFVSIKAGYNDTYTKKFGNEYQYSINNPGDSETTTGAIMINRIGQLENETLKRIYDGYCARADQGFNSPYGNRVVEDGENLYTDTYPNRLYMNDFSNYSQICDVIVEADDVISTTTSYEAILQLCDMF